MATAELQQAGSTVTDTTATWFYHISGVAKDVGADPSKQSPARLMRARETIPTNAFPEAKKGWKFIERGITGASSPDAYTGFARYEKTNPRAKIMARMGTITEIVETQRDIEGNPMRVQFDPRAPNDTKAEPAAGTSEVAQTKQFIPRTTLIIRHSTSINPFGLGGEFVGTINTSNWLDRVFGASPEIDKINRSFKWLCIGVDIAEFSVAGVSSSTGTQEPFDIVYTFVLNLDTWHKVVSFINPDTGQPPRNIGIITPPITVGQGANGIKVFQVQGGKDFKLLPFIKNP